MVQDFRKRDVNSILDGWIPKTIDKAKECNNYLASVVKRHSDVFLGWWIYVNPHTGKEGLDELERCIRELGVAGNMAVARLEVSLSSSAIPTVGTIERV